MKKENKFKLNTDGVNPEAVVHKKALEDWNNLPLLKRIRITISNDIWFWWRLSKIRKIIQKII